MCRSIFLEEIAKLITMMCPKCYEETFVIGMVNGKCYGACKNCGYTIGMDEKSGILKDTKKAFLEILSHFEQEMGNF
jgi:uncharacterized protein (DUF983 family)